MIFSMRTLVPMLAASQVVMGMKPRSHLGRKPVGRARRRAVRRRLPFLQSLEEKEDLTKNQIRGREIENNFIKEAMDLGIVSEKSEVELFHREWVDKAIPEAMKLQLRGKPRYKFLQYNVLAHGLASDTSGFAGVYKDEAPVGDFERIQVKEGGEWKDFHLGSIKAIKNFIAGIQNTDMHKEFQKLIAPDILKECVDAKSSKKSFNKWARKLFGSKPEIQIDNKSYRHLDMAMLRSSEYRHHFFGVTKGNAGESAIEKRTYDDWYSSQYHGGERMVTKANVLPMPKRMHRVAAQIMMENPDVIFLQEIDRFESMMEVLGEEYEGVVTRKPATEEINEVGKQMTCAATRENGGLPDGVAIIWKRNKLRMVPGSLNRDVFKFEKKGKHVKQKQVYMFLELESLHRQGKFVVGTAHCKSGKSMKDVPIKTAQLNQIKTIIADYKKRNLPVVFGCDLNTPADSKAYTNAKFETAHTKIVSAYPNDKERVTACKFRKAGEQPEKQGILDKQTIDFIYYTEKDWECERTLQVPTFYEVNVATGGDRYVAGNVFKNSQCYHEHSATTPENSGQYSMPLKYNKHLETMGSLLPCPKQPSDHFLLCAELVLNPSKVAPLTELSGKPKRTRKSFKVKRDARARRDANRGKLPYNGRGGY